MEVGLTGKAAVVTGVTKGAGLAVARALGAEGVQATAGARHFDARPAWVREFGGGLVRTL